VTVSVRTTGHIAPTRAPVRLPAADEARHSASTQPGLLTTGGESCFPAALLAKVSASASSHSLLIRRAAELPSSRP
jgi:hypothetical protein